MRNDWQLFESTKFGEPRNLAIQVSDDGKLGSAVYEVPDVSVVDGKSVESLDRFAVTLRNEERHLASRAGHDGCSNTRPVFS